MKAEQKKYVKFKDKNNNLYNIEIEITHRNGYPELTMSGEGLGGSGQVVDDIKPANTHQQNLIKIWKEYHLNGMNAGTPKQQEKLQECEKTEYENKKIFLNSYNEKGKPITPFELDEIEQTKKELTQKIQETKKEIRLLKEEYETQRKTTFQKTNWFIIKELNIKEHFNTHTRLKTFYDKTLKTMEKILDFLQDSLELEKQKTLLYDYGEDGKLYEYGGTWHRKKLPETLWKDIQEITMKIEEHEETNKKTGGEWEDINDYKIVALGKYLEIEPKEAEEDITTEDEETYTYCGTYYYVLTENEAHDRAEEYLGDEMWQMAVQSGNTELGKQEWVEQVINIDGLGHILNTYDGSEYYDDENEVYIFRG